MPILHALVLGIVQGLTEFLPISSSGHLELVPWLFGWNDLADDAVAKAFDTSLHLGTLIAVIFYMRAELGRYIVGGLTALRSPRRASTTGKAAWLFVGSAIPAGIVGLIAQDWITDALGGAGSIAVSLIVFGLLLWWADRRSGERNVEEYRLRDAMLTGCAQVLALNPGTSRSGITISMARMIGFSRDAAARISFLMSIPVMIGGSGERKTLRMVAQYATLGNLTCGPDEVPRKIEALAGHCDRLGRDRSEITLSWNRAVCIGETTAEAEADRDAFLATRGLDYANLPAEIQTIIDAALVVGDADTIGETFTEWKALGVDGFTVSMPAQGHRPEMVQLLGRTLSAI